MQSSCIKGSWQLQSLCTYIVTYVIMASMLFQESFPRPDLSHSQTISPNQKTAGHAMTGLLAPVPLPEEEAPWIFLGGP